MLYVKLRFLRQHNTNFFLFSAIMFLLCSACNRKTKTFDSNTIQLQPISIVSEGLTATQVKISRDASKFEHASHEKKSNGTIFKCSECHVRQDNSVKPIFPGHNTCISCHVSEFTKTNSVTIGICSICHSTFTSTNTIKIFPELKSYKISFSPEEHRKHSEYLLPEQLNKKINCVFCHANDINGIAIAFPNHLECYACHLAEKNKRLIQVQDPKMFGPEDCSTCHFKSTSIVQPFSVKMTGRAYAYRFSHKKHEQVARCQECHNLNGSYSSNQVSVPKTKAHLAQKSVAGHGCFSCHNGQRSFADDDFTKCSKCHGNI